MATLLMSGTDVASMVHVPLEKMTLVGPPTRTLAPEPREASLGPIHENTFELYIRIYYVDKFTYIWIRVEWINIDIWMVEYAGLTLTLTPNP